MYVQTTTDSEMLDVVDEHDRTILTTTKSDCYKQGFRPRIVNVAVIDPDTKHIAVQTRGENVSWQPGHYCISACGHVAAGEEWDAAAKRELFEEMGINASVTFIDKYDFTDEFGDPFMMGVYSAEYPHVLLRGHAEEVTRIYSLGASEVRALISKGEKLHNLFVTVINKVFDKYGF